MFEDECASNPCQNAGVCLDAAKDKTIPPDSYKCKCKAPWSGAHCAHNLNTCADDPLWRSIDGDDCKRFAPAPS